MTLSIITINYNNIEGLRRTTESVLQQTWNGFEWIIIDGGSKDGSKEIIENTICANLKYWCSEPDNGVYHAMNKGIAKASGDYILFLNSGDWLCHENVLLEASPHLNTFDVIYGNLNFVSEDSCSTFHYPEKLSLHYFLARSLGHQSTFIKTSLLKEKGYREDLRIVSDWYRFIECFRSGKSFKHINVTVSNFDMTGVSMTNSEVLQKEFEVVYKDLFGAENRNWIDETIYLHYREELFDKFELKEALRLYNRDGKRRKLLRWFVSIMKWIDKA